jgi:hypothetical protein
LQQTVNRCLSSPTNKGKFGATRVSVNHDRGLQYLRAALAVQFARDGTLEGLKARLPGLAFIGEAGVLTAARLFRSNLD